MNNEHDFKGTYPGSINLNNSSSTPHSGSVRLKEVVSADTFWRVRSDLSNVEGFLYFLVIPWLTALTVVVIF